MRWIVLTDGISPFELGGMQKHSYNLVRQLVIQGQQVLLAHCITGSKKLPNENDVKQGLGLSGYESISILTFRFPNRGKMPGHYIQESYAYSDLIYQSIKDDIDEYDVIFAQGFSGWKFIEEKKRGKKMPPIVNHLHGLEMFQKAFGWKSKFQQWMLRGVSKWNIVNADATVSLGGRINDLLINQGIPSPQILTITSGIDESWFVDQPKDRGSQIKMLFVGRFERRKGLKELIKAYKSIVAQRKEIHLSIAGPIPDHLKDKQSGIVYLGAINDEAQMMRIMDEHHVLVVPSISEGMPTVILEGMSRGMAIVCADVGANAMMVDSQNGWVMNQVSVNDLIEVLDDVHQTSLDCIIDKGKVSCNRVKENWGWKQVGSNHIQTIESWINNFKK
jgi:glycosyltransferase involved in cell wall biosynthesis